MAQIIGYQARRNENIEGRRLLLIVTNPERQLVRVWDEQKKAWQGQEVPLFSLVKHGGWIEMSGEFEEPSPAAAQ